MRKWFILCVVLLVGLPAVGQGMSDLLAGKLVDPKVGQWAWYDLTDTSGQNKFRVRQAIVDQEKVDGKTGYWVELEIVPAAGFRTLSKMLLTGPAVDPRNIHKIVVCNEPEPPQTIPTDEALEAAPQAEPRRELFGKEAIQTGDGPVNTEHYRIAGADGPVDVWVNEKILPTGIVRIVSSEGEMILRNAGFGGEHAATAIDDKAGSKEPQITVKTGKRRAGTPQADTKEPTTTEEKRKKP